MTPKALVHLQVDSTSGVDSLKRKIFELRKKVRLIESSSVYKRWNRTENNKQCLEAVVQIDGYSTAEEYSKLSVDAEVQLLDVEGELRLDPQLTLPSPALHLDSFVLYLAAECSPHWEHRVRQRSLSELVREVKIEEHAEFLTQGKTLISL